MFISAFLSLDLTKYNLMGIILFFKLYLFSPRSYSYKLNGVISHKKYIGKTIGLSYYQRFVLR